MLWFVRGLSAAVGAGGWSHARFIQYFLKVITSHTARGLSSSNTVAPKSEISVSACLLSAGCICCHFQINLFFIYFCTPWGSAVSQITRLCGNCFSRARKVRLKYWVRMSAQQFFPGYYVHASARMLWPFSPDTQRAFSSSCDPSCCQLCHFLLQVCILITCTNTRQFFFFGFLCQVGWRAG